MVADDNINYLMLNSKEDLILLYILLHNLHVLKNYSTKIN